MKKSTLFAVSACISMAGLAASVIRDLPIEITSAVAATVTKNLAITVTSNGGGGQLPAGVTLSPIDGETLTGANNLTATTNTHSYYTSHGFTNAASSSFNSAYNNGGWDDPRFFPIVNDYSFYPSNSTSIFKSLGLNTTVRVTGDVNLSTLASAGIYVILATDAPAGQTPGPETVGWHVEEPSDWSGVVNAVQGVGDKNTGRFRQPSNTVNQIIYGAPTGTPGGTMQSFMSDLISTSAGNEHLDIPSADIYWFAGSTDATSVCDITYFGGIIYSGGTILGNCSNTYLSADQAGRGDHYGDMVDTARAWLTTYSAPVAGPYIETEDGLLGETGKREILPQEWNWAVWSTLTHGSRMLLYFGTTSNFGSVSTFGFSKNILSGASISMFNQAPATHALIKNVAPILNSPFALNYASVTPAGYVFPTSHLSLTNGIDLMAKWYTGGAYSNSSGTFGTGFYIFATMRGSESQSSVSATFTLNGTAGETIPVVGEGRNVVMSGNSFTDTFGYPNAVVHIYGPISYP